MISHYRAKFGGHRHCDSGDIIVLVCHVISQEYVIKRSRDFNCSSPSMKVAILPSYWPLALW